MTQLDDIQECVNKLVKDVGEIKSVLKGDEYGNPGLVKDHKDLKERFYVVKEKVQKILVVGGVLAALLTLFIAIISIFK